MKGSFVCLLFAILALTEIRCASVYGEKEDAKKTIEQKAEEFKVELKKIESIIKDEKNKIKKQIIDEEKRNGDKKKEEVWKNFDKSIIEAIKQAITKGKPISTVDCIMKVAGTGRDQITELRVKYDEILNEIVKEKEYVISLANLEADLIGYSLKILVLEALQNLETAKTKDEIENIQKSGVGSCLTALKHIRDIQSRLIQPNPTELINNAKNTMEKNYQDLTTSLNKKLQKC